MALIDPTEGVSDARSPREGTKHPGICLLGFFSVIVGAALGVHLIMQVIL